MARLNDVELAAMQTRTRRFFQRRWELRAFVAMLDRARVDLRGKRILDAGCGSGYGTELLQQRFSPCRLVGFDVMPEQIERARAREVRGAELRVGDITRIEEKDASFDAVFVFGILHHVPEWRLALRELARVLRPSGVLLVEELQRSFVDFSDRFLGTEHPEGARFDWPTFRAGLRDAGFDVLEERRLALDFARSFLARKTEAA
jgi:ubiquinone/menaquinone biosynthesis C-methylase UbiE